MRKNWNEKEEKENWEKMILIKKEKKDYWNLREGRDRKKERKKKGSKEVEGK